MQNKFFKVVMVGMALVAIITSFDLISVAHAAIKLHGG
jgi:hypothetical protein